MLRLDYQTVKCSTCPRIVERCISVIQAIETKHGNITCPTCEKAKSKARGIAIRKPKVYEKSLLAKIANNGLQDECDDCYTDGKPTRYSTNLLTCPKCGLVNMDRFEQNHFRNYKISEDKE